MRLLLALEQHFRRDAAERVFAQGPATYNFLAPYTKTFDEVVVLARVAQRDEPEAGEARADGPGVSFWALPDYLGPWQYLRHRAVLRARAREAVRATDAYILRVPGLVGRLAWLEIQRLRRPYGIEVVGDPWDALGQTTWPSVFTPLFRVTGAANLQAICRGAAAVHYVTRESLQRRYPPAANVTPVCYSDVELSEGFAGEEELARRAQRMRELSVSNGHGRALEIGFIGSLAQMYKGPDILLRACRRLLNNGASHWRLSLVGEGALRGPIEDLARSLGLENRVTFRGQLPHGRAISDFLDGIDLFILPSRTEGLPRAMLEAMARGCPCIASNVGGIPELLAAEDVVPPNDAASLADKIIATVREPGRMAEMSRRNFQKAAEFRPEVLAERRREFYLAVRARAEGRSESREPE